MVNSFGGSDLSVGLSVSRSFVRWFVCICMVAQSVSIVFGSVFRLVGRSAVDRLFVLSVFRSVVLSFGRSVVRLVGLSVGFSAGLSIDLSVGLSKVAMHGTGMRTAFCHFKNLRSALQIRTTPHFV